jgi:hypothetical protein
MRALLGLFAAVSLVAAAGACGNTITVPDQGVVVLSCNVPNYCYRADCSCKRADATPGGTCITDTTACNSDNSVCTCMAKVAVDDMGGTTPVTCEETAAACVGRGVLCAMNNNCQAATANCGGSGVPPQLVPPPGGSSGPALEPHCPYVDDVCCPGPAVTDGGTTD